MSPHIHSLRRASVVAVATLCFVGAGVIHAQTQSQTQKPAQTNGSTPKTQPKPTTPTPLVPAAPDMPTDYVIGPDDVLGIVFWRDKEMSADVKVRPDGKITLLMVNDVKAAGLTPVQLAASLVEAYKPFQDTDITVVPKEINSRKVHVLGEVGKQGPYPLPGGGMNIVQLIAAAGGFTEFAKKDKVQLQRPGEKTMFINFKDIEKGKNLTKYLVQLKPGDTIIVP